MEIHENVSPPPLAETWGDHYRLHYARLASVPPARIGGIFMEGSPLDSRPDPMVCRCPVSRNKSSKPFKLLNPPNLIIT
jgi:hypothetical protein